MTPPSQPPGKKRDGESTDISRAEEKGRASDASKSSSCKSTPQTPASLILFLCPFNLGKKPLMSPCSWLFVDPPSKSPVLPWCYPHKPLKLMCYCPPCSLPPIPAELPFTLGVCEVGALMGCYILKEPQFLQSTKAMGLEEKSGISSSTSQATAMPAD